jgi:hypothetical protein
MQNYVAHKKYYCSASAKANPPSASLHVSSDNEDEEPVAGPAPKMKQVAIFRVKYFAHDVKTECQ